MAMDLRPNSNDSDDGMPGLAQEPGAGATQRVADAVPNWIAERFLKVDQRYYFADRTLAFTDTGVRLKTGSNNTEVIRALVAIAQARGWDAVQVKGAAEFRRQVWREAGLRGIEVQGYEASDVDRAEMQRAIAPRPGRGQKPEQTTTPRAAERGTALLTGVLLESGAASYKFDPHAGLSYYLKLQTDQGERTLWGVDLERAIVESQTKVQVGDTVAVENRGSQPVTVKSLQRDATGTVRDEKIQTHRNAWVVEKPGYFEARAQRAAVFRDDATVARAMAPHDAELSSAIVGLWLGDQFAQRLVERPEDRERLIALVKDRLAQALERGEPINTPRLKQDVLQRLEGNADGAVQDTNRPRPRSRAKLKQPGRGRSGDPGRDVPPQMLA